MSKTVLLVGHCGPDSSYLRMTVKSAIADAKLLAADDSQELTRALAGNVDLILFNRELGYGFDPDTGVGMIALLKKSYPNQRMMLVSNYPDAQLAATKAGALQGFGKREIGKPRVTQLLRDALADVAQKVS
jgi:hypothetical protein